MVSDLVCFDLQDFLFFFQWWAWMELGTNSKRLAKEYRERESDHKRKWLLFYFLGLNFINEIILGEHTYFWEWYLKLRNGRGEYSG